MLIEKDYSNKKNSKFICDRCKKELSINTRISIYSKIAYQNPKKRWDLCSKCYAALVRGIEKK